MDEWLKQSGFLAGNALLSATGLAFALGAPTKPQLTAAKKWWVILWSGLFSYYFFATLYPVPNSFAIFIFGIANAVSTFAVGALWLEFSREQLPRMQGLVVVIGASSIVALAFFLQTRNPGAVFLSQLPSWVFFVLLAWNFRGRDVPTTILLLAYANLQLPAGLFGKQGVGVDLVSLIAAKLSLIMAMYNTLGKNDDRPKPSNNSLGRERRELNCKDEG